MGRASMLNKSSHRITALALSIKVLFGILLLFFAGCKRSETPQKITDGSYCYHAADDKSLFLQLEFSGKKLKGRIFEEEEALGKRYYDFSGTVLNDSTLNVKIRSYPNDISQQWSIHYTKKGIVLDKFFAQKHILVIIDCEKMPNLSDYSSFVEIMKESELYDEEEDGYNENNSKAETPRYYEAYNPNASAYKRIQTVEYIVLWINDEKLRGKGAGYFEGEPEWTFSFSGTKKDNGYEVSVLLSQGANRFESTEIWILTEDDEKIHLSKKDEARPGNSFFRKTETEDVPDPMMTLLLRENTSKTD